MDNAIILVPNYNTEIKCFPSCLASGEATLYPTITASEHISLRMARNHEPMFAGVSIYADLAAFVAALLDHSAAPQAG